MSKIDTYDTAQQLIGNGSNYLTLAIEAGDKSLVEDLIKLGANVNENRGRALTSAVKCGNLPIVRLLTRYGAVISSDILNLAIQLGDVDIISGLIDIGIEDTTVCDVLKNINYDNEKSLDTIKLLINCNMDVNICGGTLLCTSIIRNNIESISYLLNNGADPNLYNIDNNGVPLDYAIIESNEAAAKLLVEAKADPNAIDNVFPLFVNDQVEIFQLLINAGLNIDGSFLEVAIQDMAFNCTELLLKAGFKIDESYVENMFSMQLLWGDHQVSSVSTMYRLLLSYGMPIEYLTKKEADIMRGEVQTFILGLDAKNCASSVHRAFVQNELSELNLVRLILSMVY